ncbi:MAG: alpha/beta fold hydrolase [Bradymonadaceae bacterium]
MSTSRDLQILLMWGLAMWFLSLLTGCVSFHRGPLPGEPTDATYAQLDDARLRYVDVGAGPPVVLLHGFASSLDNWTDIIPRLEDNHRVLAMDLKGFGWSDRPSGDYSPLAQARHVRELMDARGIERAAFVAHSWGASVALAFALEYPERVSRLVIYSGWVYEEQLPSTFIWARASGLGEVLFGAFYRERPEDKLVLAFHDKRHITQDFVDHVERTLDRPGTTAAALAAVRGQRYIDSESRYKEMDKPTLLLWGREDAVARLTAGERLVSELPNAELVTFARCGHFPMIEAFEASTHRLVEFLAREVEP